MSGISMSAFEQMEDALGTWRFLLTLPLPGEAGGAEGARDLLLRCQQVVIPGVSVEQMLVGLHGHERTFRGRQIFSKTMACTFIETRSGVATRRLRSWKELVVGTNSGNGAPNEQYAVTATLEVLDTATGEIALPYKIRKVWIQDIPEVQLDGSGSNVFLQTATFSFDSFHLDGIEEDVGGESVTL